MVRCKIIGPNKIVKIRFFIEFVHLLEEYSSVVSIKESKSDDCDYELTFLPIEKIEE